MATVLVTGGTGLIGNPLIRLLSSKGYQVIILTRHIPDDKPATDSNIQYALWDVKKQIIDTRAVQQADYIIHLAGAGVAAKRWTVKYKKEIIESRTESSKLIIKALKETDNKVKAVISASATGWYGEDPKIPNPHPFVETNAPDEGFLGETCRLWEESILPVTLLEKRLVILRTGIVLDNKWGALAEFKKPVYFGVAGILGNGKQMVSWIHVDDICHMYAEAIENEAMQGVYNAVAPKPVSNKELTLQLAKVIKGNFYISAHVPVFLLKTMLGEMSTEVLKSATVSCEKIRKAGYNFLFPAIDGAIENLLRKQ